jgi:glycogen synthase
MTDQEKLNELLAKRTKLMLKGSNDEKLNNKIRELQKIIRDARR